MEDKKYNNTLSKVIFGVSFALSLIMFAAILVSMIFNDGVINFISNFLELLIFGCVGYYAIYAYKKPHGREMKICMLVFAGFTAISSLLIDSMFFGRVGAYEIIWKILTILGCLCVTYMAGRLKKIKENRIIAFVALGLFLIGSILFLIPALNVPFAPGDEGYDVMRKILGCLLPFVTPVLWLSLFGAYIFRFDEHREAKFRDESKPEIEE